ncbi:MAG: hypothetical protein ACW96U_00760 [Candidatus Heimdallarchaeaceae archaeon]|jgi:hypothetical protein
MNKWKGTGGYMKIKGLDELDLQRCLDNTNEIYDNNVRINQLHTRVLLNLSGIKATEMSDVIIATVNEKPYIIKVGAVYTNPFNLEEWYEISKDYYGDYGVDVYTNALLLERRKRDFFYGKDKEKKIVSVLSNRYKTSYINFTLRNNNCKKKGAQRTDRRRTSAVCWHVHRDFMKEIFDINPDARLTTALMYYKGKDHFYETYQSTQYRVQERYCNCR